MFIDHCEDCIHKKVCRYTIEKKEAEGKLKDILDKSEFSENAMFSAGLMCSCFKETAEAKVYRQMLQC